MKRVRVFLFLALILVALPVAARNIWSFSVEARSESTFVAGDEIFVLNLAKSIYTGGYFGMRCREGHTGSCYGGTQAFIDAVTLRMIPSAWLKGVSYAKSTEVDLPQLKYPRMLKALRWTRVGYAALLVLVLGAVAYWFSRDFLLAFAFALIAAASPIYENAFQGVKNNHASALWELLFLLTAFPILNPPEKFPSRGRYFLALFVGLLATFVRPILLPMLVLFGGTYFALSWWRGRSYRLLALDMLLSCMLLGFGYCALHPNIFVSSLEANWIISLLHSGTFYGTAAERILELKIAVGALWVWVFVLVAMKLSWKRYELGGFLLSAAFFLANGFLFFYLNLKPAYLRTAYYLPVLVLGLAAILYYWPREKRVAERFSTIMVAAFLGVVLLKFGSPLSNWGDAFARSPSPRSSLDIAVNEVEKPSFLIDLALRAPVHQTTVDRGKVSYFDSVSETPAKVASALRALGSESPETMIVTCWGEQSPEIESSGLAAPATILWAKTTRPFCHEHELVTYSVFAPYIYEYFSNKYTEIPVKDFLRSVASAETPPVFSGVKMSPRIFRNFWEGMDHFGMPLKLEKNAVLTGDFIFPSGLSGINIPLASDCKDKHSQVQLKISTKKRTWVVGPIYLDITDKLCGDYPRLCKSERFRNWSKRRFPPAGELKLELSVAPGEAAHFEIATELNGCDLALQNFDLTLPKK
ncbi:MAG: hypothetical protein ACXVBE_01495 [Bdellovibrionota bacterium]